MTTGIVKTFTWALIFFSILHLFLYEIFLNSCQRMAGSIEMTIILKLCGTERICLLHVEVLNKAIKERHYSRISIMQSAIYIFNIPRIFFALKNVPVSWMYFLKSVLPKMLGPKFCQNCFSESKKEELKNPTYSQCFATITHCGLHWAIHNHSNMQLNHVIIRRTF